MLVPEDNNTGRMSDSNHAKNTYIFDTLYPPSPPIENDLAKGRMKTFLLQKGTSTDVDRLEILMKKWPDFANYDGKLNRRTGTIPFMPTKLSLVLI
ncbi:hypothetical protein H2248_006108 [Termitomyces sp. 'cryptogamus']|nr:hypothetical protein H2248_006108 [Termitomyces sp. 'cryptogamus']